MQNKVGNKKATFSQCESLKLGDSHRFGQSVLRFTKSPQKLPLGISSIIFKPRPVELECFFWSKGAKCLKSYSNLPNFEVKSDSEWSNFVTDFDSNIVLALDNNELTEYSHSLGEFAFLAIILGFTDFHRDNTACIRDRNGKVIFAPLDIETIFYESKSLLDTGILDTKTNFVGGYRTLGGFDPTWEVVLEAFFSSWIGLEADVDDIISEYSNFMNSKICRAILLDTEMYRKILVSKNFSDLSGEEILQINANDIPYFFYELGQETLLYFSAPGSIEYCSVLVNEKANKYFEGFKKRFEKNRRISLVKQSIAQLVQKGKIGMNSPYHGNGFSVKRENEMLVFSSAKLSFGFRGTL
jgi:lantibiotic modifying enzyme